MRPAKSKSASSLLDRLSDEVSWQISHAQALDDYGRREEAAAERARAAGGAEQLACLLEADGQEREAAIHRVTAATLYEKLGQHVRAVTLLRAALSSAVPEDYRARIDQQRRRCLAQAQKLLRRSLSSKPRNLSSL